MAVLWRRSANIDHLLDPPGEGGGPSERLLLHGKGRPPPKGGDLARGVEEEDGKARRGSQVLKSEGYVALGGQQ